MRKRLSSLLLVFCSLSVTKFAKADSVSFTLGDPVQAGPAGTTFTYDATITAAATNAGDVYLNSDSFNLTGSGFLDDTDFANFPLFLAPGQMAQDAIFTISDPSGVLGITTGTFSLLGGGTDASFDNLGTASFSAQVTPEPASLLLLTTGVAALGGVVRRRRSCVAV